MNNACHTFNCQEAICSCPLKDIVVFSKMSDKHIANVEKFSCILHSASATFKLKNCKFIADKVDFLGYMIHLKFKCSNLGVRVPSKDTDYLRVSQNSYHILNCGFSSDHLCPILQNLSHRSAAKIKLLSRICSNLLARKSHSRRAQCRTLLLTSFGAALFTGTLEARQWLVRCFR